MALSLPPFEDVQTSKAPASLFPTSSQVRRLTIEVGSMLHVPNRLSNLSERFIRICNVPDWLANGELNALHRGVGEA